MAQTTLIQYNNKNLFSNYYLDNKVKTSAEWTKNDHIAAFSEIKKLYDEERKSFENFNEAQLIKHFLDPIFKILLFEPETEEAAGSEFPDFALFKEKNSRDEAHKNKGTISFYTNVLAIGDAKKWDADLDGKPIHQIRNYLDVTEKKWGILTNGRKWRLFCKEKKRDEYYEIDLPSLLDSNDIEGFKYFFYFFRRDAFLLPDNFLENVLHESEVHAKTIGDNLKDNVYKAMKKIAEGFLGRPQNNLDRNDEAARERVQKNTMLLLYRLLFLLYAEDRNLLDIENAKYLTNHSFRRIKQEVKDKRGRTEQGYDYSGTTIWDRLKSLFELINVGSNAIGEKEFHVPAYNGGLFDTSKNPELEKWKIGDKYLAEAIHLLTWSDINGAGGFVDYSELEIRHLGSIYEGLLEYKLKVAEADNVAMGNEWVALEKYNEGRKQKKSFEEFDEFSRARKGELYLATDKGERKATGSYYTPDYIVNYIVRNTIGAVVDEKWKEAEAKKQSFIDATLSVKVLDPAMGSGHFLVGAVEFLADRLLSAAQKDIEARRLADEPRFSDLDWARREAVAHCIYGVDLNPMAVELAKVSLWLKTISREKPLSFLDHRLKQGNSLIGARLERLHKYPDLKAKKEEKKGKDAAQQTFEVEIERPFFGKIVKILKSLTDINDDSIENIDKKKQIFKSLIESPEYQRIKAFANLNTAVYFGNEVTKDGYGDVLWGLRGDESEWRRKTNREWFGKARRLAEDKSFFHWELEFPEIFFEGGAQKENPGWDAVVGNPPYFLLQGREEQEIISKLFPALFSGSDDISYFFLAKGLDITKTCGMLSYIITRYWMDSFYSGRIRQKVLEDSTVKGVVDFQNFQVFGKDVNVLPIIVVLVKNPIKNEINTELLWLKESTIVKEDQVIRSIQTGEQPFVKNNIQMPNNFEEPWNLSRLLANKTFSKIDAISQPLGELILMTQGLKSGRDEIFVINRQKIEEYKLEPEILFAVAQGYAIERYEISSLDQYIIYTPHTLDISKFPNVQRYLSEREQELKKRAESDKLPYWSLQRPREKNIVTSLSKILSNRIATGNCFTCTSSIPEVVVGLGDINMIITKPNVYHKLEFISAVLNSKLLDWYHKSNTKLKRGGYYDYSQYNVSQLPIRRISFTTPPARRADLAAKAKALYSAFLGAPASKDSSSSFGTAPNSLKILDFVSARLDAKPEESDVVHDLLAYLAERMIEMNKAKNAEIKGFLDFLKGEIGASIDDLSNKTAIQEYYTHEFWNLIEVLVKNKKKLKEGYNPKSPNNYETLQEWYNRSVGKLAPLMRRIEATDGLIDSIVYRLYGLTDDEIKIVEESISGEKNAEGTKT